MSKLVSVCLLVSVTTERIQMKFGMNVDYNLDYAKEYRHRRLCKTWSSKCNLWTCFGDLRCLLSLEITVARLFFLHLSGYRAEPRVAASAGFISFDVITHLLITETWAPLQRGMVTHTNSDNNVCHKNYVFTNKSKFSHAIRVSKHSCKSHLLCVFASQCTSCTFHLIKVLGTSALFVAWFFKA